MNNNNNNNINIVVIDDNSNNDEKTNTEIESIMKEIEESSYVNHYLMYRSHEEYLLNGCLNAESKNTAKTMDYEINYTLKQLLRICDYYGITKEIKANKLKKEDIISFLIDFEENVNNTIIVYKREQLWFYMNELKNDNFMKKFLLW
jgi:hypothetical protein